jgi:hypothetical protein
MNRRLVVLGTYHRLQGALNRTAGPKNIDDPSYGVLVRFLLDQFSLDWIFEEASECGPTTAKAIADDRSVEYSDVDPNEDHRAQHGIQPISGDVYDIYKPSDPDSPGRGDIYEEYLRSQVGREEYWIERIKEKSFANGLIIVGYLHALSVAVRLESAGFHVTKVLVYSPGLKLAKSWLSDVK